MPKIVGDPEEFREGFHAYMQLHGDNFKDVGAFAIKPPVGEGFNLKLGNGHKNYKINKWHIQGRDFLVKDCYAIDAKKVKQDSMTFEKWIKKEVKSQYFKPDMSFSNMNDIFWNKLLPSEHFAPNYATGMNGSLFPSKLHQNSKVTL